MGPCHGRVALVTGSSRGLGRVIAQKLSEAGADLVLNYRKAGGRSEAQARALAKELVERGSRAVAIQADISQKDAVATMFQEIAAQYGRLDILVLNAARAPFKKVGELLRRDLLELVENNYFSNVYCMQQALPLMQGRPGHVVFVSSLGSRFALPSYPLGSMKAAMEALVKQWAVELQDRQITVHSRSEHRRRQRTLQRALAPGVRRLTSESHDSGDGHEERMAESLISPDQIYREVQKAIADALQISEQKVEPDSSLIRDLAAESLDFIDINFRLEQRFNVGMPRKYFLEHVEELFGEGTAIDESGRLTEAAVTIWNARLGSAGPRVHAGMPLDDVPALVTPRTLVMIVGEILATCPATCPGCGKAAWAVADGSPITCGGCGAHAPLLAGDDVIRRWLEDFRARGGSVSRAS